jgi:lysophospholipase L1-like esterase
MVLKKTNICIFLFFFGFLCNNALATSGSYGSGTTTVSGYSANTIISVNKIIPSFNWSKPANIIAGTALNSTQLKAQASMQGTFTYDPANGTIIGIGIPTLTCYFVPTDTANYSNTSASVSLTVTTINKKNIFIGNSLIAGYPGTKSWIEPMGPKDPNPSGTISYAFQQASGLTAYNMGYAGQRTDEILARFSTDVIAYHPANCFIEGGVNDVDQGVDNETILSNVRQMIQLCENNAIHPFLFLIFPWTDASNEQAAQINYLNDQYQALKSEFPDLVIVDCRSLIGTYSSGKWSIKSQYDVCDATHLNVAGYYAVGNLAYAAYKTVYHPSPDSTDNNKE